jgi:hypothetical protein
LLILKLFFETNLIEIPSVCAMCLPASRYNQIFKIKQCCHTLMWAMNKLNFVQCMKIGPCILPIVLLFYESKRTSKTAHQFCTWSISKLHIIITNAMILFNTHFLLGATISHGHDIA